MLRKRFSTKLLALIVAAVTVIPTTVFAADAADQTAKQGIDPAVLLTSEEATTPAEPAPVTPAEPAPVTPTEPAPVTPAEPAPVTPVEPAPVTPAEPAPVTPAEPTVPAVETPSAIGVTEPAIVVDEVVTEPAIVVEPVVATLTITHRLIVGDQQEDMVQTVEGLTVGQTINLADYVVNADNVVCISNPAEITIDEESDSVVIEYNIIDVKIDSDTLDVR